MKVISIRHFYKLVNKIDFLVVIPICIKNLCKKASLIKKKPTMNVKYK